MRPLYCDLNILIQHVIVHIAEHQAEQIENRNVTKKVQYVLRGYFNTVFPSQSILLVMAFHQDGLYSMNPEYPVSKKILPQLWTFL